ncbi:T9SS type A sorting domain-containing protein [Flavobacteriaceae bacterium]|nr:T9SS type A sorting domain-containing protein [Flavobacteriaceae bacterium]
MKFIIYVAVAIFSLSSFAQETVNVMFYNLLNFPDAAPGGRSEILRNIFTEFKPDLFLVCELQNERGADEILNISLNYNTNNYSRTDFIANQSGSNSLQQLLYYSNEKFLLESSEILLTPLRDINKYVLKLNTLDQASDPILIYIYVAHLKSSQGSSNEDLRLEMVNEFTDDLENLDSNSFVLFAGDFNLYSSEEPAYQEILDASNAIVMVDPINTPGTWHNNENFQEIHTQSTRLGSGPNGGASGGLDDRFDFITISENIITNQNIKYVPESYKALGNNANCFNLNISDETCTGEYSQTLRNQLYSMSDHLPVIMKLETTKEFVLNNQDFSFVEDLKIYNTLVSDNLTLVIQNSLQNRASIHIFNMLGQKVKTIITNNNNTIQIDTSDLESGLYFLISDELNGIQKFLKI